jgi:hypothetical protein
MNEGRRQWWVLRALRGHPLTRRIDRLEALAYVMGVILLSAAVFAAVGWHDAMYASRSRTIAAETAALHPVDATAVAAGKPKPTGPGGAAPTRYSVHVEWFAQNATRDGVIRVDHAVKAGEHVRIWLDGQGKVARSPQSSGTANLDAVTMAALLWMVCAALVAGALAALRRVLNGIRHRDWDRNLRLLIEDAGGSTRRS